MSTARGGPEDKALYLPEKRIETLREYHEIHHLRGYKFIKGVFNKQTNRYEGWTIIGEE